MRCGRALKVTSLLSMGSQGLQFRGSVPNFGAGMADVSGLFFPCLARGRVVMSMRFRQLLVTNARGTICFLICGEW